MNRLLALLVTFSVAITLVAPTPALADAKTDQKLDQSRKVFEAFSDLTEQSIPTWLLERAYGIVVVPGVVKVALTLGGRGGKGVMAVRNPDGSWSDPVFVTLGGVNLGFQWGVQSTDMVLVLMSRQSVEGISGGKVTLGADASVAAGPLGRSSAAATDATLSAQVLSYSRSSGLFAGVAIDGSVISIDKAANETAYGMSDVLASQILEGKVANVPESARAFRDALTAATTRAEKGTPPAATTNPATAPAQTAPTPAPGAPTAPAVPSEPAKTYPMEDPNPGAPPPSG